MEGKIEYRVVYREPHRHFVDFELMITGISQSKLQLQLPAWRPGRYELGNFAKNVQRFAAFTINNEPLTFRKLTKDLWEVDCDGHQKVKVAYNYFANELNAGNTFVDHSQL